MVGAVFAVGTVVDARLATHFWCGRAQEDASGGVACVGEFAGRSGPHRGVRVAAPSLGHFGNMFVVVEHRVWCAPNRIGGRMGTGNFPNASERQT